ncbi:MAG TPA: ASCH domain-containing protein [Micromonospora sp.]|nr:ASCH domain-containing protein [Micromonospora sp.]
MHDLPKAEFAFPGPLRDQLVAAILTGAKTSTTSLRIEYEHEAQLPQIGQRSVVVDSEDKPVAVIEVTEVRTVRLGDIDLAHALDEGEGYASVAEWRAGHESFWHSTEYRRYLDDPAFTVNDDTLAVAERFRVVECLPAAG